MSNLMIISRILSPIPLRMKFFAYNAYNVKDVLKAHGWRWDPFDRMWWTKDMDACAAALDDLLSSGEQIDCDDLDDLAIAALPEKTRERVFDQLSPVRAKRIRDEMGRRMTNAREPSGDAGLAPEEAKRQLDAELTQSEVRPKQRSPRRC